MNWSRERDEIVQAEQEQQTAYTATLHFEKCPSRDRKAKNEEVIGTQLRMIQRLEEMLGVDLSRRSGVSGQLKRLMALSELQAVISQERVQAVMVVRIKRYQIDACCATAKYA